MNEADPSLAQAVEAVVDEAPFPLVSAAFLQAFGRPPEALSSAPGRVNLLGEHTDYNDGFVLPVAIPQRTRVALGQASGPLTRVQAQVLGTTAHFSHDQPPTEPFARYVYGCLRLAEEAGLALPPLDICIASDVPLGVGLSSSAALEVAVLRALRARFATGWDDVQIARMAQRAEIEHAGVRCGILDQMASSLADPFQALFLDTRSLERRLVPLPSGAAILVLDSGISRSLATSGYNERRAECEAAAQALGVAALRDVDDPARAAALPAPLDRRARHVITENARVLQAAAGVDAETFGALMNASHASLRGDYEVSVPPLDWLVARLQREPGVFGARLTGAGFGGACVALCAADRLAAIAEPVLADYAAEGEQGRQLVP
ncbi:galactokinase [Aquabacterium sp. J223]|uniref:galactokinase n=1 Tax=Aquabacterium sp. J223 TaxID=2898431 RepID=UPI0021AE17CB|nr:galactokinase [Aquabacterium sp. J223]UUX97543.1 galactokinase [Aquabacterium sp. J223]